MFAIDTEQRHSTAIVEYAWRGTRGVLVLGDNQRHWQLPGGDAETYESSEATAIREVEDWIGMRTYAAVPLFNDRYNIQHTAFLLQATGQPRMLHPGPITAIGLCRVDMHITTIMQLPDFDPALLRLSGSSEAMIRRFWNIKARSPLFFESLHTSWSDLPHLRRTG